jgi:hypothetical protein
MDSALLRKKGSISFYTHQLAVFISNTRMAKYSRAGQEPLPVNFPTSFGIVAGSNETFLFALISR